MAMEEHHRESGDPRATGSETTASSQQHGHTEDAVAADESANGAPGAAPRQDAASETDGPTPEAHDEQAATALSRAHTGDGLDPALIERLTKRPRMRRHHFGLFGPMGVGKTTYLAALYLALDRAGYLNHDLTDADSNAFLDWFVRHLHSGQLLPATQQSWEISLGITRGSRNQRVALRDIPGGWFTEESDWEDKLRDIERQLQQCRGSIFFIDTGIILHSSPDSPERRFINRVIDRAIRRTQKGFGATLTGVRPPVAICFSKADLLTREHAPDVLTAEDEETLLKQKAEYLWGQLGRFDTVFREGRYHHAAYFALSALGSDAAPNEDLPLKPHGVEEPFWFALEATRSVKRTRRRRMVTALFALLLGAATLLAVMGYTYYQREAVPAYEELLTELADPNVNDEHKLRQAQGFVDRWQRQRLYTLGLVGSEIAAVREQRDQIASRIAAEKFELFKQRTDEPEETARRSAAEYEQLLEQLREYRSRFPNAEPRQIETWLHIFTGKHELAQTREALLAGTTTLDEELELNRKLDSVADRYPALTDEVERAKQQYRRLYDERNYEVLQQQVRASADPAERLVLINRYLATQPSERYRDLAQRSRATQIDTVQQSFREALNQADAERAAQWRLEQLHVLEEYNLEFGTVDPELGSFFFDERRKIEEEYANRQLDELYAYFRREEPPLSERRDALRAWLSEHIGHPREEEVARRIDQYRQREVERRFAELVEESSTVSTREELVRFLERLRDYRDANPTIEPSPTYEELERRARINWPQTVLGGLIEQSRQPRNWDDSGRCLDFAQRLDTSVESFVMQDLDEVRSLVEQAREHADELRFRAKELDWRAVRERYLSLFSSGLRGQRGLNRIDEVLELAEDFLATHDPRVSPQGREHVQHVRDFLEWVKVPRTYSLNILNADFSEGGTHDAAVAFDHSRDGDDWDRRILTRRIREDRPRYDESFTVRWAAFDWCHVLGLWHRRFNRRGIFFRNTQRGFLSLLDVTGHRLTNQRDDGPSNWVFIELEWPAAAPDPVESLPRDLPR